MSSKRFILTCPTQKLAAARKAMRPLMGLQAAARLFIAHRVRPKAGGLPRNQWLMDWNMSESQWPAVKTVLEPEGVTFHDEGSLAERTASGKGLGRVFRDVLKVDRV